MEKTIRVRVMGREYPLRVDDVDEVMTLKIASYVDAKMQAFKTAFPKQSEVTTAVVTALALAEELFTAREAGSQAVAQADREFERLDALLAEVMVASTHGRATDVASGVEDGE